MMVKNIVCGILFSCIVSVNATSATPSDSAAMHINLNAVTVSDKPWQVALKEVTQWFQSRPSKEGDIDYFGRAQYFQILRFRNEPIQLRRDYGWFWTRGFLHQIQEKRIDKYSRYGRNYGLEFIPVYAAHSLPYDGTTGEPMAKTRSGFAYNAYKEPLFQIINMCYLFAPCFCDLGYYQFDLLRADEKQFTISFRTNPDCFPHKIPWRCSGSLVIDHSIGRLESVCFDELFSFASGMSPWKDAVPPSGKEDILFSLSVVVSPLGFIRQAYMQTTWLQPLHRKYHWASYVHSPPRPDIFKNGSYSMQEWWEADSLCRVSDVMSENKFKRLLHKEMNGFNWTQSQRIAGIFDATVFSRLPAPEDFLKSEVSMNKRMNIEDQYTHPDHPIHTGRVVKHRTEWYIPESSVKILTPLFFKEAI